MRIYKLNPRNAKLSIKAQKRGADIRIAVSQRIKDRPRPTHPGRAGEVHRKPQHEKLLPS